MNFGKRATDKKRNALASHSAMIGKKAHVSIIRIIFIFFLIIDKEVWTNYRNYFTFNKLWRNIIIYFFILYWFNFRKEN